MTEKNRIQISHAGGVLERDLGENDRYGIVPRELLEDPRLALDSRAVAAWLAAQAQGFQISIFVMLKKLGLGKDRWQRIAHELEGAGYLQRSKSPSGAGGRWVWRITFNPTPRSKI
jgi:hypothetical protein